jgi:hypothetical protein
MRRVSVARWAVTLGGGLWTAFALWASLGTVGRLGDDSDWLVFARRGLLHVWTTPSPFWHFRPVFGTWVWLLRAIGATSPSAFALAGLMLQLLACLLLFFALRPRFDVGLSAIGAVLVLVHPARRESLFWASAQIDLICFGLCMAVLSLSQRSSQRRWPQGTIALLACLAFWAKETAIALPLIVWLTASPSTRRYAALASGLGVAAAAVSSGAVLRGVGRVGSLQLQPWSILTYLPRLLAPSAYGYRELISDVARGDGGAALSLVGAALSTLGVLWLVWSTRLERDWGLALVMIGVAAALFSVEAVDRSIWFGVIGVVWLVCLLARRSDRRASVFIVLMMLSWPWLWCDAWRRFSLAQHISRDLERATAELPSHRLLFLLGVPERIARAAWIASPLVDHVCMRSVAPLTSLAVMKPRSSLTQSDGRLLLHPLGEHVRASCASAWPAVTCSSPDVRIDVHQTVTFFSDDAAQCGSAAWFHWDGQRFVQLEL